MKVDYKTMYSEGIFYRLLEVTGFLVTEKSDFTTLNFRNRCVLKSEHVFTLKD